MDRGIFPHVHSEQHILEPGIQPPYQHLPPSFPLKQPARGSGRDRLHRSGEFPIRILGLDGSENFARKANRVSDQKESSIGIMTNFSKDPFDLRNLFRLIHIHVRVVFITLVWLVFFAALFIGYFSIPLILIIVLLTVLTVREEIQRRFRN